MSTPTQPVEKGKEKGRRNGKEGGNNRANNGEGPSTRRSTAAISSTVQVATVGSQSRNVVSQSSTPNPERPSEDTRTVTARRTEQISTTVPERAPNGTVQPRADDSGSSSTHSQDTRVEELEPLLRGLHTTLILRVRNSDGSGITLNRVATRENPLFIRLPTHRFLIDYIEVEAVLRERAANEMGSPEAGGNPQGVDVSSANTQAIQDLQESEVDELILPVRPSRPYRISFDQEQRRQADGNATPDTTATPTSQTPVASSSQTPTAEAPPNCTICYEPFTTASVIVPCGHEFDLDCILPWFRRINNENPWVHLTCPLCRQRAQFIRHSYTSQGNFQIMDIERYFRGPRRTNPQPRPMPYSAAIPHLGPNGTVYFTSSPRPPFKDPWVQRF
jgi:hypothetical protein